MKKRFNEVKLNEDGTFSFENEDGYKCTASFNLFLIKEAWGRVDYEDLADGFGEGVGTHGDWSAIRDSSPEAKNKMLERALNALFG
jgi:hypothetical protein